MIRSTSLEISALLFAVTLGLPHFTFAATSTQNVGDTYTVKVEGFSTKGILKSTKEANAMDDAGEQCGFISDNSLDSVISVNKISCLEDGHTCEAVCHLQVTQEGINLQKKRTATVATCTPKIAAQLENTRQAHSQYERACQDDRDFERTMQCLGVDIETIFDHKIFSDSN